MQIWHELLKINDAFVTVEQVGGIDDAPIIKQRLHSTQGFRHYRQDGRRLCWGSSARDRECGVSIILCSG
jgi:hypothetical protein